MVLYTEIITNNLASRLMLIRLHSTKQFFGKVKTLHTDFSDLHIYNVFPFLPDVFYFETSAAIFLFSRGKKLNNIDAI